MTDVKHNIFFLIDKTILDSKRMQGTPCMRRPDFDMKKLPELYKWLSSDRKVSEDVTTDFKTAEEMYYLVGKVFQYQQVEDKAKRYLLLSATLGYPRAQYEYYLMLDDEEISLNESIIWLVKATNGGIVEAANVLIHKIPDGEKYLTKEILTSCLKNKDADSKAETIYIEKLLL